MVHTEVLVLFVTVGGVFFHFDSFLRLTQYLSWMK